MTEKDHEKLEKRYYPDEREKYEYFWRSQSVFSRWHQSDFEVDGNRFSCIEEYMMCQKAVLMTDDEQIATTPPSYNLEKEGKYTKNLRHDLWDEKCVDIVEAGIVAKFSQNRELKQKLLNTYPKTLVEASPIDKVWGIGLGEDDRRAWNEQTWKGQNLFGKVLTKVRDNLIKTNLLQELIIADESEDVDRPSLGKEEFNDSSDKEKPEENIVDQDTENQERNGSMDIGADENRQKVPGEESKEKNVSETWTPPDCHISRESELNKSHAACCQGNSFKDKESDGENERNSKSKEIDMNSKSENAEEVKEVHDGYQLKPKQGNQIEHSGSGGGGRHKKGKKNKTKWKKLDFQQEEKIPELKESQYTGPHSQRDSTQTKKYNDGENQKFENRGGHEDSWTKTTRTINLRFRPDPFMTRLQSVSEAKTAQAPVDVFTAVSPVPTVSTTSDRKPSANSEDGRCTVS